MVYIRTKRFFRFEYFHICVCVHFEENFHAHKHLCFVICPHAQYLCGPVRIYVVVRIYVYKARTSSHIHIHISWYECNMWYTVVS